MDNTKQSEEEKIIKHESLNQNRFKGLLNWISYYQDCSLRWPKFIDRDKYIRNAVYKIRERPQDNNYEPAIKNHHTYGKVIQNNVLFCLIAQLP